MNDKIIDFNEQKKKRRAVYDSTSDEFYDKACHLLEILCGYDETETDYFVECIMDHKEKFRELLNILDETDKKNQGNV